MNHLILISHGNLCKELKNSVEMIMGPQENIHTVSLMPSEDPEIFLKKFNETTNDLESFTVFADLIGGTPCNVASKLILKGENFDLYSGMNMAMVIEFIINNYESSSNTILSESKNAIAYVNDILLNDNEDDEI